MDKAYIDFGRLFYLNLEKAYFVVRAKDNIQFKKINSRNVDKDSGIRSDHDIYVTGPLSKDKYPDRLRRIEFYDAEFDRYFVFLTNNFVVKAKTVAQLYKHRWYVELFFKWIKQNLKIKSFWGHSENAVRIQMGASVETCCFSDTLQEIKEQYYNQLEFKY
ncbi:MAG: transposase [Bacteroidetes bacterium]|nr:transposase [Bacteroidota bacterium]